MPQRIISRKSEIRSLFEKIALWPYDVFLEALNNDILVHRVKFPLLEFLGDELSKDWKENALDKLCDDVADFNHISSWPLIGKILQNQLPSKMQNSFERAQHFIIKGNEWYVCDILSERVFGNALLLDFEKALSQLKKMITHPNDWVKRSPGIAVHLAAKRGLNAEEAQILIELLLKQKNAANIQVQKGCGWGIEAIAKFHPGLASTYKSQVFDGTTKAWIVKKYKLGLAKANARKSSH